MNNYWKILFKAILAGGAISLGCIANICSQNKIVGSLFFVIGLFLVLSYKLELFTGKACYVTQQSPSYIIAMIVSYVGNLIGALIMGMLCAGIDKFVPLIANFSVGLEARMTAPAAQIIILGYLCNWCIYIAVNAYKRQGAHSWESFVGLLLGVSVFVLCGFEHSIADMVYVTMCGLWSWQAIGFIGLVTIGNVLGGMSASVVDSLLKEN